MNPFTLALSLQNSASVTNDPESSAPVSDLALILGTDAHTLSHRDVFSMPPL